MLFCVDDGIAAIRRAIHCITFINNDRSQPRTSRERINAYAGHRSRNHDRRQIVATVKSPIANAGNGTGQFDFGQTIAVIEGIIAYLRHVIGDG